MSSMSKKLLLPLTVLLAAGALVACGGDDDSSSDGDDPAAAVQVFMTAVAEGDGEAACAYVTEASVTNVEAAGTSCEDSFAALGADASDEDVDAIENAEFEVTDESDTEATVSVTVDGETESIKVVKEDDQWKISE